MVTTTCPRCRWPNPDQRQHCADCGAPLSEPRPSPVPCPSPRRPDDEVTAQVHAVPARDPGGLPEEATASIPRTTLAPRPPGPAPGRLPAMAIGTRFQPLPGCLLVRREGPDGTARIPVATGTPVHAITGGAVLAAASGRVVIRGVDGVAVAYGGVGAGVRPGVKVRAGDIIGAAAGGVLEVVVTDAANAPVDAFDLLLGLPDPNELGFTPAGIGIDPYAIDRELAPGPGR